MYLGRDPQTQTPFHLEPKRLRTHGIVVGMTGSGKTGMSLVVLEELIEAGVPILAIDPKGDLGNLALTFPGLTASSFSPWVAEGEAEETAARWREGLARWDMDASHVATLADKMQLRIMTPGSEAGHPVDVLGSLRRPHAALLEDDEGRRALVSDTISGLLGLVGETADPVRDPAHIVLSSVLDQAWLAGEDPDLETLIQRLVDPPMTKVGVFPVDRFFPPDKRMELALTLNGVLASPGFQSWTSGAPLDIDAFLKPAEKTPVHIFSIAHLSDRERQFFLSLLLGQILAWTRRQPGTEDLRAALFFDEVAGYIPPHPHNPSTKPPLLTLMKQARAVGLGVLLATQNPADIDYKAISNAGLWCIGRLRTAQDRDRLLSGLPGHTHHATLESLPKRTFLVIRASGDADVVQSRHARCYLKGPLTRTDIATLRDGQDAPPVATSSTVQAPAMAAESAAPELPGSAHPPALQIPQWHMSPHAVFRPRMQEVFQSAAQPRRPDGLTLLMPAIYARLALRFDETRLGFTLDTVEHRTWFPLGDDLSSAPHRITLEDDDLGGDAPQGARYDALPSWIDEPKEWKTLQRRIVDELYRTETTGMWVNKPLRLYGRAGESEQDFRARCDEAITERIDADIAKLQRRYDSKVRKLEARIRKQEARLLELRQTAGARRTAELVNIGETMMSWFSGRRRSVSSALSKRRMTSSANARADQAELALTELQDDLDSLAQALEDDVQAIETKHEALRDETEERTVGLEKNDIQVERLGILWIPVHRRV